MKHTHLPFLNADVKEKLDKEKITTARKSNWELNVSCWKGWSEHVFNFCFYTVNKTVCHYCSEKTD